MQRKKATRLKSEFMAVPFVTIANLVVYNSIWFSGFFSWLQNAYLSWISTLWKQNTFAFEVCHQKIEFSNIFDNKRNMNKSGITIQF